MSPKKTMVMNKKAQPTSTIADKPLPELSATALARMFPQFKDSPSLKFHREPLDHLDTLFLALEEVYRERHRYNLHWAFHHAQLTFNDLFDATMEHRLRPALATMQKQAEHHSDRDLITREMEALKKEHHRKIKRLQRKRQIFSFMSFLVSFVDIIISLALIVVIAEVSNLSQTLINSSLLALVFLCSIALLKVTLDRFWIIPHVDTWGWELYRKAVQRYKSSLANLVALGMGIEEMIVRDIPPMEIIACCKDLLHNDQVSSS